MKLLLSKLWPGGLSTGDPNDDDKDYNEENDNTRPAIHEM